MQDLKTGSWYRSVSRLCWHWRLRGTCCVQPGARLHAAMQYCTQTNHARLIGPCHQVMRGLWVRSSRTFSIRRLTRNPRYAHVGKCSRRAYTQSSLVIALQRQPQPCVAHRRQAGVTSQEGQHPERDRGHLFESRLCFEQSGVGTTLAL